jgi:hypothetical protein
MNGQEARSRPKGRLRFGKSLRRLVSLLAVATSLASLFAASWVGLALLGY